MEATETVRKQTAFRLRDDLIIKLKIQAQRENRSLNNYVESVLLDAVYRVPNDTTLAAMKEAENDKNLETLDVERLGEYIEEVD